ncbi:MAG: Putative teichuronic acid biosynthesis glycosyltransferase TuaG [Parabacteroides distasonis]
MSNPKVSILTPCHNASATIRQTIESVLAQTYPHWELLAVDDCSTDDTAGIIKSYADKDSRIRYLKTEKPSGGPSTPRNIGLEHATGQYIALLDSDDMWLSRKLEEQLAFMKRNGCGLVYSNYEKMAWDGTRQNRVVKVRDVSSYWDTLESSEIPCLTVLFKRELAEGIRFKPVTKEDFVFWIEILRRGHKAHNTGHVHALYREVPHSRSANKFAMFRDQWHVLRRVEGVKKVPALYFMAVYVIKGLRKHLK